MKTYPSKKDAYIRFIPFFPAIIIGIVALVNSFNHTPNDWSMIFIPIVLYIGMSFLIKVTYSINNNKLIINNLILKRKLDILHFHSIRKQNKFIITTEKAGMSKDGIVIKYSKYDELFISPENQDEFIQELLAINPSIVIEN